MQRHPNLGAKIGQPFGQPILAQQMIGRLQLAKPGHCRQLRGKLHRRLQFGPPGVNVPDQVQKHQKPRPMLARVGKQLALARQIELMHPFQIGPQLRHPLLGQKVAIGRIGPRHRMPQHRETAMPRPRLAPFAQRLPVKGRDDPAIALQPRAQPLLWPRFDRLKQQGGRVAAQIAADRALAFRLEIRGMRDVEEIHRRKPRPHGIGVRNLVSNRFRVLLFEPEHHIGQPPRNPQKPRQPVDHLKIQNVFIINVIGRLPADLQPVDQPLLKALYIIQPRPEFANVKFRLH